MLRSRLPLLITGITGVAGYNAFHYFRARYPGQVIGTRPAQTWRLHGQGIAVLDAEDGAGMRDLFDRYGFHAVLNAVGNCKLKSCELDPAMARALNVFSAAAIAENVNRHGCRLVHLSSDLVFSGDNRGAYGETAAVDPVTVYGKTMAQAEDLLLAEVPTAALLRISLPMGPSFNHHAGAIDWIQSRFRAARPATLYFDEVRSCTYCEDLNKVFELFLASDENGLFHCGGPRASTLFEIAQVINRVGDYAPELLKGCPRIEAGPMPPRAGNVSMNSAKLVRALGYQPFHPWPLGDDLWPQDRRWHFERPLGQARSVDQIKERLYRYPVSPGSPG
ncbi:MAG TPA: sugar nucleotide-binding protein [Gemmataceae bacterium]|jgi:dTDP-4-dehydrorhamnose reductase|nr:sugar nucleotide-binding protein [Gemmataceae bacterium]